MEAKIVRSYRDAAQFGAERFTPVGVGETAHLKVVLTCFEPGQFIPVHAPDVDMALVIIEGEAQVAAGNSEEHLGPGAIVVVPAGENRGVKALTRTVAVHVVSPPPSQTDHAAVEAGLRQGAWR